MKFMDLYILNGLWGLILLFLIMVYGMSTRKKILHAFADAQMFDSIVPGFSQKRRWIKAILIVLAFALAIVALAGPQMGYKWEKATQKGVDIMIALDCSNSMLARDIRPNRLERAKREIIDLLRMMHSDRAGLVAFSGTAFLQCPLTLDHQAFHIFLNALEPGFLPVGGTNLNAAIETCWEGFEKDSDTQKAIIIITDGETTTGAAEQAAKKMAEQGVKIFTIGVGDLQGAPIPGADGGFKKDASGNIILSRVDEKGLKQLADLSGGAYVRSVAGDMDLDLIYTEKILGGMEKKELVSRKKKVWENRYQWLLFPSLILFFMELLLPPRKKQPFHINGVLIALFCLFVFWGEPAHARMVSSNVKEGIEQYNQQAYEKAKSHFIEAQLKDPENMTLYYNIGAAAYKNQEYEQAVENFLQASKSEDEKLRHAALYNLANAYYRMNRFEEAIENYEHLLREFPEDIQAKENLEFVKQKQKEQQKQSSDSDQNKNDDQNETSEKDEKKDQENTPDPNNDQQKNPDQQENKEQNNPPDSDSQKSDQENPESQKDNQEQKASADKEKEEDAQNPPPEPQEQKSEPDQSAGEAKQGTAPNDKTSQQAKQQMEQMLNRLEDKPGKALMPVKGGGNVEKDW